MPQPLLVSGEMRAMFSAIGVMPARACSMVTPALIVRKPAGSALGVAPDRGAG